MVQSCYLDAYFTQDTYIWQPVQSNCQSHMALIVFVCQEVVVPVLAFAMRAALDLLIMVAAFWKKKKSFYALATVFIYSNVRSWVVWPILQTDFDLQGKLFICY